MGLFGGGNSKSTSASNTSTVNQDNRSVADATAQSLTNGAVGARDQATVNHAVISIVGGGKKSSVVANVNVNNTNTDYGAIGSALKFATDSQKNTLTFAKGVEEETAKTVKNVLGVADGVFSASNALVKDSQKSIADAYSEAKGGAKAVQNIAIGLLVALVATAYFMTKAK